MDLKNFLLEVKGRYDDDGKITERDYDVESFCKKHINLPRAEVMKLALKHFEDYIPRTNLMALVDMNLLNLKKKGF